MKIEDKRNEKKTFGSLKVGDVFKYANNLYMKIYPFYPIDPNDTDTEVIEDFISTYFPVNAYSLLSHEYNVIGNNEEVQPVKATLVIE